ncbi:PDZ domain-containing protein [Aequorivita sp. H23M31]|uniref:PDZ domain-containing protein n=1 Tax=Aequorivita ciconiae TaxID=2494375 RepID=A0A451FSC1_9FLAO|nr:aspartyl protease family protein [Aequorivita sp. H23M31]QAA80293.1 PDZ domain-containing protein [Aequorivita sp. H23M31]
MFKGSIICILFLWLTFPVFGQAGFHLKDNKKRSRIPFELVNNLPIIKVNINGSYFSFILDTGVKSTILFSTENVDSFQKRPTVPVRMLGLGPNGYLYATKSKNNIIKVGNAVDNNHEVYFIFDSSLNFSPRMGIPINGILGNDFFRNFVVKINYSSRSIVIYDPKRYSRNKCNKCEDLPLRFINGKPYIDIKIGERSVTLLVDSGNSDVLWLFDENDFVKEDPKNYFYDFLGLGLGGDIYGNRARVPVLSFGDFQLEQVLTSFPDEDAIAKARLVENRDGSVGGGFLSRFDITFNYPQAIMQLKKNTRFDEPFNYNMSGITLEQSGTDWLIDKLQFSLVPRYVVVNVRDGSPAQIAGVQKGDIVLSINGKPNYTYKLYDLINLFSTQEGRKIILNVKRGMHFKTIRFSLKRVF